MVLELSGSRQARASDADLSRDSLIHFCVTGQKQPNCTPNPASVLVSRYSMTNVSTSTNNTFGEQMQGMQERKGFCG